MLRVAVVGSGPAGFYAADALLASRERDVSVDMLERLPVPFGLLRTGVAPDHQRIKQAARAFERTGAHPRFRFFGNVTVGRDVSVNELLERYDQVLLATGSARERRLGIPGEDLAGVHGALSFVGWYNGHPDFADARFDLSASTAVVVGAGNVAMDVTRMLVRNPEELRKTDIVSRAHAALAESRVRRVIVLARRGPAQAAFSQSELADIAGLAGVGVVTDPVPVDLARQDPDLDSTQERLLGFLAELAERPPAGAERTVELRFLRSPVEALGDKGRLVRLRLEKNELVDDVPRRTGEIEEIEAGLVFSAIGFLGAPIPGVPFDERRGIVPNDDGRVLSPLGTPVPGLYVVGWIKRGPRGLIGSNKGDAKATAQRMLEDASEGTTAEGVAELLAERGIRSVSFSDWRVLDALEQEAGRRLGKVREKLTKIDEMLDVLERRK